MPNRVENDAITVATEYLQKQGYEVENVGRGKRRNSALPKLKGTSGNEQQSSDHNWRQQKTNGQFSLETHLMTPAWFRVASDCQQLSW